jgi:hypothetical protein
MLMTKIFLHKNAFFSTLISPIDPASQPYHATRLSACFRTASFSLGCVGPEKKTLISFSDPTPRSVLVPHRQCKECTRCQVCYFSFCEPIHLLHKNPACSYWRLELEQRKKHTRNRGFLVSFGASQSDYEQSDHPNTNQQSTLAEWPMVSLLVRVLQVGSVKRHAIHLVRPLVKPFSALSQESHTLTLYAHTYQTAAYGNLWSTICKEPKIQWAAVI